MQRVPHLGYPTPRCLLPALYWRREPGQRPEDFVAASVPTWCRQALSFILRNGVDAHPGMQALGWAKCRICGEQLGSMDLTRFGYVWPQKAEHYVVVHGVWTPECSAILQRALSVPPS